MSDSIHDIDTIRINNYHSSSAAYWRFGTMVTRFSEPLFVISVAARLVEMHPQTLRKYEREGLVAPSRTSGNLRLYSDSDIEQLRQVKYLVEKRGLNLAGVQLALELTRQLRWLQQSLRSDTELNMEYEFDSLLLALGFLDQSRVASRGADSAEEEQG